jgi:YfiH family protein
VHGSRVLQREGLDETSPPQADASWCATAGLPCTVLTADCLPVLLCDLEGTRVAAAHAGWRGLAGGVLQATVQAMDADPARLLAWLGPGISAQAYQVDAAFRDRFLQLDAQLDAAFTQQGTQWHADLYAIARKLLADCGVGRVFGGEHCTYTEARLFFSYRRDGACGRMATTIWLD